MSRESLQYGSHVVQYRNPGQTPSHAANRAARSSSNLRSIDRSQCNAPNSEITVMHDAGPAATGCMMHITISAEFMMSLRRIVIGAFGEIVAFMRIQAIDHATKMKICLRLTEPIARRVMDAIMHALPGAEFGRISPV